MTQVMIPKSLAINLNGNTATENEVVFLRSKFSPFLLPHWLLALLQTYKLAGTCFSLAADDDMSGLGVEMIWLSAAQMVSEAFDFQPGISVVFAGLLPIGSCAIGSGDPYFLDMRGFTEDPPLLRVLHDYASDNPYPLNKVEVVASSLGDFFSKVQV